MVALNTAYAPSETRTQPKNRVGNFFGGVAGRAGENRLSTRNRIGENGPTLTIIASGRPFWPSRDPIEEDGGLNLYAAALNNGLNEIDYLGLASPEDHRGKGGRPQNPPSVFTGGDIIDLVWEILPYFGPKSPIPPSLADPEAFEGMSKAVAARKCSDCIAKNFDMSNPCHDPRNHECKEICDFAESII